MPTKNIQDVVAEQIARFDAELFNDDGWNMRMYQETKDWLTTTLTQLVKEVEAGERDRIREVVMKQKPTYTNSWQVDADDILEALTRE